MDLRRVFMVSRYLSRNVNRGFSSMPPLCVVMYIAITYKYGSIASCYVRVDAFYTETKFDFSKPAPSVFRMNLLGICNRSMFYSLLGSSFIWVKPYSTVRVTGMIKFGIYLSCVHFCDDNNMVFQSVTWQLQSPLGIQLFPAA